MLCVHLHSTGNLPEASDILGLRYTLKLTPRPSLQSGGPAPGITHTDGFEVPEPHSASAHKTNKGEVLW